MGFLSSLFGGGGSKPATTTNVVSQKLPDEIAPFVSEVLKEGKAQFEAEKAAGYRPYTGQTSADLTAEQERALTGLSGLVGTQQPFIDESAGIIRQGAEEFTGDTAQKFMSPYQQAVTDIEKREATRNFEGNILPRLEAQAVGAGAMSGLGSRAGVEFSEAQRNQSQLLADIQAKGQQRAFDAARNEFGLQKAREAEMAGNIANLGGQQFSAGLSELGALKSAGEERQLQSQGALDEAYFKFLEEQQFPKQNLAEYQQLVYGNPLINIPTRSETGTKQAAQASTGQQLLNLGIGAGNIFGLGGGFSSDGFSGNTLSRGLFGVGKKEGGSVGGLSDLPIVERQAGMQVGMIPEAARASYSDVQRDQQRKVIEAMPDSPRKEQLKMMFDQKDPTKQRQRGTAGIDAKTNLVQKSIQDIFNRREKGINTVGTKRTQGIQKEKGDIDTDTEAGRKRVANLMKNLGTDVGGEGVIGNQGTTGVIDDIGRALNATAAGGFRTNRLNKELGRKNTLEEANRLEKIEERASAEKKALRTEARKGDLEDTKLKATASYNALTKTEQNKVDTLKARLGLENKIENYPKEIQDALVKAEKDGLTLKQAKASLKKTEAETRKLDRQDMDGNIITPVKPAVYNALQTAYDGLKESKLDTRPNDKGGRDVVGIGGKPFSQNQRNRLNRIYSDAAKLIEANKGKLDTAIKFMETELKKLSETPSDLPLDVPSNARKVFKNKGKKNQQIIWYDPNNPKVGYDVNGKRLR